jgi:predicted permease
MTRLLRRLVFFFRRGRMAAELAEEMEFHRSLVEQDLGGDRAAAARAMGAASLAREDARAVWLAPWLESLWQDLAYAFRGLRRQPGFTAVALTALSLAIGLNTSLFTVFNAVAFRQWPVKDPAQVVTVSRLMRKGPQAGANTGFGVAEWRYIGEHSRSFQGLILAGYGEGVDIEGRRSRLRWVTGNYFSVLGVGMLHGRGFRPEEDLVQDPQAVAVLSYLAWQNKFGADPEIVGRTLRFDDVPFTIVGVAPQGFTGTSDNTDLWAPLSARLLLRPGETNFKAFLTRPDHCCLSMAGRLAPGATRGQAAAEVDILMRRLHEGKLDGAPVVLVSGTALLDSNAHDRQRIVPVMAGMFLATTLVLLLACANVGNLLLARAAARHSEIAVRLALGGTRLRLIRQLLMESLTLAAVASAAGLAIAAAGPEWILPRLSEDFVVLQLSPDLHVCAYAVALAFVACVAFGLAPSLHGTRGNIAASIRNQTGRRASPLALRSFLLASQVAISVVLLAAAGLLVRGLQHAQHRDPGFRLDGITVAGLDLPASAYSGDRLLSFVGQFQDALEHAGGLPRCAVASDAPMANSRSWTTMRRADQGKDSDRMVQIHDVTREYFEILGIPIVEGRNFAAADAGRKVLLLNQTAARRFWGAESPVGKMAHSNSAVWEVVGVVKDAYTTSLAGIEPTMYWPLAPKRDIPQVLIGGTDPVALERIAAIARRLEPRARLSFAPLADNFRSQLDPAKYAAELAGALGVLALALASIGMSGVFAYAVRQRTREIGVRMALGAQPAQVVRLVLASSLRAVVWGLIVGLMGSLAAGRLLAQMMNGASAFDPLAYVAVFALLAAAAAAASFVPARRAAAVDPVTALRWE